MPVQQWLSRGKLPVILIGLMLSGLFFSRALLSIASITFIFLFLLNKRDRPTYKEVLWGCCLVLLPVLLSVLWSTDTYNWWRAVEVKVPLLTIGLGLTAIPITRYLWRWIIAFLLLLTVMGSIWSVWQFIANSNEILQGYLQAKVMPTPFDNDHIRFSWLVVLVIILSLQTLVKGSSKNISTVVYILLGWLILYLHLLAAKTGLLCLYAAAMLFIIHKIFVANNKMPGILLIVAFFVVPVIAYVSMPSLHNRVQYILYDFSNYSKGVFIAGSSDGARVLSLQAGWQLLTQHPVIGVGFGDLKSAIEQWHQAYYPQSFPTDRFLPLNEWLLYGAASGWIGIIALTAGIFLLLRTAWSSNINSRILCVVLVIPLITDDTLESQFGVVIFIFVLMVTRQLLNLPERVPE